MHSVALHGPRLVGRPLHRHRQRHVGRCYRVRWWSGYGGRALRHPQGDSVGQHPVERADAHAARHA
eukprot:6682677-Prymnesium_polylepis.1